MTIYKSTEITDDDARYRIALKEFEEVVKRIERLRCQLDPRRLTS